MIAVKLKAQEQPFKFILSSEYALDGAKPLFEDRRLEYPLAPPLYLLAVAFVFRNVRCHSHVEYLLPVDSTIISGI